MAIKAEPSSLPQSNDNVYSNGMYSGSVAHANGAAVHSNGNTSNYPTWNFASQQNPFNHISNQLVSFCCPPGSHPAQVNNIRLCLAPDNIKHFLEQYTNFQGHFPMIHMPTFSIENAYPGLLLAMICIGAVYSERVRSNQVRELMEHTKAAIDRDSRVLLNASQDREIKMEEPSGPSKTELEEIQAVVLMQILFTFHGTPIQREMARRKYPILRKISEMMRLNQPSTTAPAMSLLHQPNVDVQHCNAASFDWATWVEQEKRSRLFYVIYLLDSAMVIYFNSNPLFDPNEITLPLPADDAAWDAWSSTLCAEALSLHGAVVAKEKNPDGSRRAKQPEMNSALRALVDHQSSLKAGTTNVFSKFILIHALLVQLWCRQKQAKQDSESASVSRNVSNQSSPQNGDDDVKPEIKMENGSVQPANEKVAEISPQSKQHIANLSIALDKWKRTWDEDIATQYPSTSKSYRRFGFCRDGIHFYYLAKYFINKGNDYRVAPDKRFTHVIHLLKSVKAWVVSDSAQRNEELGSVGDIDQGYGANDLTLDMAQFFKPFNRQLHSPIAGVHTNIGMGNGNSNGIMG